MDAQTGYVKLAGRKMAAHLTMVGGQLNLEVTDIDVSSGVQSPSNIEILVFHGSQNVFSLLGLQFKSSKSRLGIGGTTNFSVRLALEGVTYKNDEDISGKTWLIYLEDFAKILHITGLQHQMILNPSGGMELSWYFKSAVPVTLNCPKAKLQLRIGQDMKTGGDLVAGPSLNFRYPVVLVFEEEQQLNPALVILYRIRSFFSLLMGRVLEIEELALRLEDGGIRHDARVHGLPGIQRSDKPKERLVPFADAEELAAMLDNWLERYDEIEEAIGLHIDGLEQRDIPWQIRFQIFVQALEALHRRTGETNGEAINVEAVSNALREQEIADVLVKRVIGILGNAHEPSLTHRLRMYWDQFSDEIAALRPAASRGRFVEQIVATRHHFAHRTDQNSKVLKGGDLWDHTETIKAISHMALLHEIGGNVTGLGAAMLSKRFAEYAIVDDT